MPGMPGRSHPVAAGLSCLAVAVLLAVFVASLRPGTDAARGSSAAISLDGLVGLLGSTSSMGVAFAYRAGVVTVAIGMMLALLLLRGVPDNFGRSVSSR